MTQVLGHSGQDQAEGSQTLLGLDDLAGFEGPAEAFWLALFSSLCGSVAGSNAAAFKTPSEEPPAPVALYPQLPQQHGDGGAWLQQAQQTIASRPVVKPGILRLQGGSQDVSHLLLTPLREPGAEEGWGVACMWLPLPDLPPARECLYQLQLAAQVASSYQARQALRQREHDLEMLSHAMQIVDVVNREPRFRPAAIGLCNQAADTWRATRVSVGFLAGQTVKLRAMSHTEDLTRKMQLVQDLEAAMEECIDQDSEILAPATEGETTINRQAMRYTQKHGPTSMCLIPLRLRDKVVGAMVVEWPTDHTITTEQVESLRLTANLFTARLHQFYLDDRWLGARMATSLRKGAAVMVGAKHTWAKLVAIAGFALIAFAFLAKGDDTVNASFEVQTTQRQVVTAPFESTLLFVGQGVEVGEAVLGADQAEPGGATVLAQLDTSELHVELAAIKAQIADFVAQAKAASSEGDLTGVEIARANVDRLEAQAKLYNYRIERSTLTSPISGVVIEGDLKQRINGSMEKGEVLFEVAPLDAMRAELLVPASRIGDVRSRLKHPDNPSIGELASASHPGDFIGFTVERIEPEAEVVNGENVFRVRVALDKVTPWVRPGVEGKAKVHVNRRSYAYLWTRDAVHWVRMKLWL